MVEMRGRGGKGRNSYLVRDLRSGFLERLNAAHGSVYCLSIPLPGKERSGESSYYPCISVIHSFFISPVNISPFLLGIRKILIRHIDIRIPAQLAVQLQRFLPARESVLVDLVPNTLIRIRHEIVELGLLALILPPAP